MITYRKANENDYISINNFFNRIYSANRTIEEFYWEFHNGPFGKSVYVIAEDGNNVVGTNCVIPIILKLDDGTLIKSGKSEDTLVDPNYRGQRIFFNIYEFLIKACQEEDIKVIWGFSSAKNVFEKIGFSVPFSSKKSLLVNRVSESYKILKKTNNSKTSIDRIKVLGMCVLSKSKMFFKMTNRVPNGYRIITSPISDGAVEKLIDNNLKSSTSLFGIQQTSSYQTWRLYNNPNLYKLHTYGVYDKTDKLIALIVLNSRKDNTASICQATVDYQSIDDNDAIEIFKYVIADILAKGIVLINDMLFDTNSLNKRELRNLSKAGFTFFNKGNGFVWKIIGECNLSPENFYLSMMSTQGVN